MSLPARALLILYNGGAHKLEVMSSAKRWRAAVCKLTTSKRPDWRLLAGRRLNRSSHDEVHTYLYYNFCLHLGASVSISEGRLVAAL